MKPDTCKYEISNDANARLETNFVYHSPKEDQAERYGLIRQAAKDFARLLMHNCPGSRELSLALTDLEACVMWANASIARNE